ncbi:MAG TPA: SAM-dependent chlorinase/fluorinase [Candidatus Kryptonia bacterium]
MPQVVLLTDFGNRDYFVGVMKGVITGVNPVARIIDLTHSISRQSVPEAAFVLWASRRSFPDDAVFVCVVDPGVGSERKIICGEIDGQLFIAPDNGLLDFVVADGRSSRFFEVSNKSFFRQEVSTTFHGRDIFAPVAGHISRGTRLTEFGESFKYLSVRPFHLPLVDGVNVGRIVYQDVFGNVVTNLDWHDSLTGGKAVLKIGKKTIKRFFKTYSESKGNDLVGIKGSTGLLEVAINQGDAAKALKSRIALKLTLKKN